MYTRWCVRCGRFVLHVADECLYCTDLPEVAAIRKIIEDTEWELKRLPQRAPMPKPLYRYL